jgi:protein-S-isoprenylcysteine O-methyltransferase Ste14
MNIWGAIRPAWRLALSRDDLIFGLILVPIAVNSWARLWDAASGYGLVPAFLYWAFALGILPAAFSAIYVTGAAALLLTGGRPLARDEALLPNLLATVGAFGVYGFLFLPPAAEPPFGFYLPATLIALGWGLALLSLAYLRRSFSVTPQARRIRQSGPYALVRHPMYLGNILSVMGLGLAVGTVPGLALTLGIAGLQAARAYFEERVLAAAFPDYAPYRAKVGAFLPRIV